MSLVTGEDMCSSLLYVYVCSFEGGLGSSSVLLVSICIITGVSMLHNVTKRAVDMLRQHKRRKFIEHGRRAFSAPHHLHLAELLSLNVMSCNIL